MPRRRAGWDLRTHLSASPDAQGTLFQGGSDQMSDRKYPRGYTPQRQAETRDAVVMQSRRPGDDGPFPQMSALNPEAKYKAGIVDTVARSTVPLEHLQNLQWLHTHPGEHLTKDNTAAGIYMAPNPGYRDHGLIAVKPEYSHDYHSGTVIHEIGHHVSETQKNPWRALRGLDTGHAQGTEEGFADNYMDAHYRDRRGNPVSENRTYGGGEYGGNIERTPQFWQGYRSHRDYSLDRTRMHESDAKYYKRFPEDQTHPDGSVDVPMVELYDRPAKKGDEAYMGVNPDAQPDRWQYSHPKYY